MSNRHEQGRRRSDDGEIKNQERVNSQGQRHAVVKRPMIFQAFDFALLFAGFKTGGTKVLAAQLTIAQGAKKSAAGRANNRGLFLRMVKAA